MALKPSNRVISVGFNFWKVSGTQQASFSFCTSKWKDPSLARWMKTLCAELKPLSRPYRHCFVGLLASYRLLQLAKLFVNLRYAVCFSILLALCVSCLAFRKHAIPLWKCTFNATRWVWMNVCCFKELLFCLTPFARFKGWLAALAS